MTATLPSLAKLKPNPDGASLPFFDRTGWKRVRFGDVVGSCNETCDPAEAGLDRFVAMEHLEPGSLHVRTWSNVTALALSNALTERLKTFNSLRTASPQLEIEPL